ncbi:MAG TPA: hypothetical protein VNO79_15775 [Actinomycetota bacterium]|nr:hypothetical protein [Actinomycetota bacterium]
MDPVQSLVNGAIVAVAAGVVGLLIHGFRREMREAVAGLEARFDAKLGETRDELRVEIGALRQELRGEIAALRQEMRSELAQVRDELKVLRSDLTLVALAVGAKPRAQNA